MFSVWFRPGKTKCVGVPPRPTLGSSMPLHLLGNTMQTHTVNCHLQCVCNKHADWSSLKFLWNKKTSKGQMWACCLKCVYEQTDQPRAEHREEFPLRLGSLNNHSSREDGCQESLRAQLANKRPGLLPRCWPSPRRFPYKRSGVAFLISCPLHFAASLLP